MENLKDLLKNGVFGILDSGEKFVVVDDHLVYQHGGCGRIDNMSDKLVFWFSGRKVQKLYKIRRFDSIDTCNEKDIIFDRDKIAVEMTIQEIEAKLGIKNLKIIKEDK